MLEACQFSARLRLPNDTPDAVRTEFVDEVRRQSVDVLMRLTCTHPHTKLNVIQIECSWPSV